MPDAFCAQFGTVGMTACADHALDLRAMIDGELDRMTRIALETHLRGCAGCRAALDRLKPVDARSGKSAVHHPARRRLREAVGAMLPAAQTAKPSAMDGPGIGARAAIWLGGGAIGVLGVTALLLVGMPGQTTGGLEDELVAAHLRSLSASHLTEVVASDRPLGPPWFERRIGFSPSVVDLAAAGFPLVGARLDHVGGRNVAVIVYGTRLHPINLFVRPTPSRASPLSAILRRDRFSMLRWESGKLEYWAVSDIDEADLEQFRVTFRQASGS